MPNTEENQPLVGQYIDSYLPAIDGVIVAVQNYARWLNSEHFPCYVATAKASHGYSDNEPYQILRYMAIPVIHRKTYRFGIPMLDHEFTSIQQDLNPDLVHAHSPFAAGREALRVARQRKIPLVASFHTKYYDDFLQATQSKLIAEAGVKIVVNFFNKADHVWAVSNGAAETLRDYGFKKNIEIMTNGTDFIFPADIAAARRAVEQRFSLEPQDKVMLYVGQHVLQKNLILLLEAASLYARSGARFKLLMIGDGYAREQLIEKATELQIQDKVIFGGVERDRVKISEIFLRADLFTFPSLYDTAGLVIREAAMANCPSILIAGSDSAENTQDEVNAYLCENTAESLSQAMDRALKQDEKRHQIGRCARQTLCESWQAVVARVADHYQEIIKAYNR